MEIENIVFSGGGVLGIALVGALKELNNQNLLNNLKRFIGSSVGSIIAGVLACRGSIDFIERQLYKLPLNEIKDSAWLINKLYRLIHNFGIYKGNSLETWYKNLLRELTGKEEITFQEIYEKYESELIITGACVNQHKTYYFSRENYPNMPIYKAVKISIGYPILFQPEFYDGKYWTDGGTLDNYPIDYLDQRYDPSKTIGLLLLTDSELKDIKGKNNIEITNIENYVTNILFMMHDEILRDKMSRYDWSRTILIDVGDIPSMEFNLSDNHKKDLIEKGKKSVVDFFNNQQINLF